MGKILIAGGTGFVGRSLKKYLEENGYEVYILSTQKKMVNQHLFYWMPTQEIYEGNESLDFEAVINLSGANIADRLWTAKRKIELKESRVLSTQFISKLINEGEIKTKYFIQASATGFYGDRKAAVLNENTHAGEGFLSELCMDWEQAVAVKNIPFSIMRIGVVLDKEGGAYPKLMITTPFRIAQVFDGGKAYMPWIALDDLTQMIAFLIQNQSEGVFNAVSHSITYKDLYKSFFTWHRKRFLTLSIPSRLLKLILGQFVEIFSSSQRIEKSRIVDLGFKFSIDSFEKFLALPKK
jgi:hypothetical protein